MEEVTYEEDIAVLTLDRPDALNALTGDMLAGIYGALEEVAAADDVRAVILHGAGDGFCAGADLAELKELSPEEARKHSGTAEAITTLLETTGTITVAAIHGPCLGGGHELALACDFRVAMEDAVLGQPEPQVGLIPGFGATVRLARLLGTARAKSLLLRGKKLSGIEAYDLGLVDALAEPGTDIVAAAKEFIEPVMQSTSPAAYKATKQVLHDTDGMPLSDALETERQHFSRLFGTHDQQEGIAAFLENRDPEFTGNK